VSAFPGGVTIASSWDKEMMYARSVAMGSEFRAKGAQIALALVITTDHTSIIYS
jgi:beta-glucosidase